MNDEYKEKLLKQFEQLKITSDEVKKIMLLLHDSITLNAETQEKAIAFLDGYRTGLEKQIEWLNRII